MVMATSRVMVLRGAALCIGFFKTLSADSIKVLEKEE
jgi:hypothetical protein